MSFGVFWGSAAFTNPTPRFKKTPTFAATARLGPTARGRRGGASRSALPFEYTP